MASYGKLRLVGIDNAERERSALDPAPVDENGDGCAVASVHGRRTGETGHLQSAVFEFDVEHRGRHGSAVDSRERVAQLTIARRRECSPSAGGKRKRDPRIGQGIVRNEDRDLARFGNWGVEELPPGGKVAKEISHGE